MSETHLTDVAFAGFGLAPELMQGIEEAGFSKCTPIQAETLPVALAGKDVAGQAQTGTGKTAAFLIAVYNHLLTRGRPEPQAIPAPCADPGADPRTGHPDPFRRRGDRATHRPEARAGLRRHRLRRAARADRRRRRHPDRDAGALIDYFKQHVFDLKQIDALVLDEADRMFDLGFIKDIRYLMRRCPPPDRAPRAAVLGDALAPGAGTGLRAHEQPRSRRCRAGEGHRRRVRQVLYHTANEEKIPLLIGHAEPCRPDTQHRLRQHQAHCRAGLGLP